MRKDGKRASATRDPQGAGRPPAVPPGDAGDPCAAACKVLCIAFQHQPAVHLLPGFPDKDGLFAFRVLYRDMGLERTLFQIKHLGSSQRFCVNVLGEWLVRRHSAALAAACGPAPAAAPAAAGRCANFGCAFGEDGMVLRCDAGFVRKIVAQEDARPGRAGAPARAQPAAQPRQPAAMGDDALKQCIEAFPGA